MLNALSFDVEEWYHAELVRRRPLERLSHVEAASERILNLLARRNLRATFFMLGEVMRDHPALVSAIAAAGHEIGCHTMSHRPLWELTPHTFAAELAAWADSAPGLAQPLGFRAPTFSLRQSTAWALDVLSRFGYRYDSSIFPVANHVYGLNGGPLGAYRPDISDLRRRAETSPLLEAPMSVWQVAGRRIPVAGGFYLRALPLGVLLKALHSIARERPVVLYLHPWEVDERTPVVPSLSPLDRYITYTGRGGALAKLERILGELEFAPLRDVLAPLLSTQALPSAAGVSA